MNIQRIRDMEISKDGPPAGNNAPGPSNSYPSHYISITITIIIHLLACLAVNL